MTPVLAIRSITPSGHRYTLAVGLYGLGVRIGPRAGSPDDVVTVVHQRLDTPAQVENVIDVARSLLR